MPFPEVYSNIISAAIVFFCFFTAIVSVPFYNTLYKKELLSDTRPTRKATSPFIYTAAAFFGLAVGIVLAILDLKADDFFLIMMIPAAVTVCICDGQNSFVPVIGTVLTAICAVLRMIALCVAEGALWPVLTFAAGGIFGLFIMLLINFISKKTGSPSADKGHIAIVSVIWASAGIVPGTIILAAAEILAILCYILPKFIIAKHKKNPVSFNQISYPLSPFLFLCYYAAALIGIF